ncbi:MAG: leucine-rich repeat domain-containing protein [Eubacterium sp.]|nr:leucine-rich repeat domain-containing protein [Eubacterium sp.]
MPFVQAKCTNCGGVLAVDDNLDAALCPFCNTPYIVEKAINNYNITNNINIGSGANVNIYGAAEKDFEIVGGVLKAYKGESVNVVIPDTVKRIADEAFTTFNKSWSVEDFEGMPIESLVIPESVVYIGKHAFRNCKQLKKITFNSGNIEIGFAAFAGCSELTELVLCAGTIVSSNAFCECTKLTTLTILDPVGNEKNHTLLGEAAFVGCSNLTDIEFGNGVIDIGNYTFERCTGLTQIVIPQNTICIGNHCFMNCTRLQNVFIYSDNIIIYDYAFTGCPALCNLQIFSKNPTINEFSLEAYWRNLGFCPRCGGRIRSVTKKCSSCGYKES